MRTGGINTIVDVTEATAQVCAVCSLSAIGILNAIVIYRQPHLALLR